MPNTVNQKNIMVGAGFLYIATAENTVTDVAPLVNGTVTYTSYKDAFDASTAWKYVGATSGGLEVSFTTDTGEVEVDQSKDAALIFNTGQTMTVGTELAEPTLANLLVSWGLPASALSGADTLLLGTLADAIPERSIAIIGNAPRGGAAARRERVYHGRRAINVDGGAHTLSRTDATTLPVSFRLLPDTTATAGQEYGRVIDRTVG